jgi:hypothetical protein
MTTPSVRANGSAIDNPSELLRPPAVAAAGISSSTSQQSPARSVIRVSRPAPNTTNSTVPALRTRVIRLSLSCPPSANARATELAAQTVPAPNRESRLKIPPGHRAT